MNQDKPHRGRPSSQAARANALRAARAILFDQGLGRLTMEAVAAQSGVGKPTLYRHWANALELAMAALMAEPSPKAPVAGDTLEDWLRTQLRGLTTAFAAGRGRQIALALAAADPEAEITRAFRNQVILASREAGRDQIARAVALGTIPAPPDIDLVLDMLYAPLFYRLLLGHLPLDPEFADRLAARAGQLMDCDAKKRL